MMLRMSKMLISHLRKAKLCLHADALTAGSSTNNGASNHGYGHYDDWRDEEVERSSPLTDTTVGEILQGALGIDLRAGRVPTR